MLGQVAGGKGQGSTKCDVSCFLTRNLQPAICHLQPKCLFLYKSCTLKGLNTQKLNANSTKPRRQLDAVINYLNRVNASATLDILLVTAVIFTVLVLIRGTRAVQLLRGVFLLVLLFLILTNFLNLPAF